MRWGVKATDTAKVSIEARYIVADRTLAVLDDLKTLRVRAVQSASAEDVGIFAAFVPLPRPDGYEEMDLFDGFSRSSQTFRISPGWYLEPQCSEVVGPFLNDVDPTSYDFADSVELHQGVCEEGVADYDTFYDELFSDEEAQTGPPSPEHELDFSGSDIDDHDTDQVVDDETKHILATPWCTSFPAHLESYLDGVEGQQVSADQLIQLQKCIDETDSFHEYIWCSIRDNKAALNRRQARYRLMEAGGDMAGFMKSGGLGSPLVDVIGIDEEWLDDSWGMPVERKVRRKIYHSGMAHVEPPATGI
ncbi:hypothetical protein QQZ08_006818 [Neonectria magnoliae]|uniref:Uncharacterized protein n=1 Tax=Neonectria magnoliae TaxID=2732573 RepID=A0ABR1HZH3_9HYPO